MGVEYELKFRATPSVQAQILADHPGPWQTLSMETTYYDTLSWALSSRHYTLRKRMENGAPVCTVKTPAKNGARGEWETGCDRIEEAIPVLCKLGAPKDLLSLTEGGVTPLCGARFTRRYLSLAFGSCTLELALDEGVLFGGDNSLPLCEVEIELKSGEISEANVFGQIFCRKYGLQPEQKSKFLRARELCQGV